MRVKQQKFHRKSFCTAKAFFVSVNDKWDFLNERALGVERGTPKLFIRFLLFSPFTNIYTQCPGQFQSFKWFHSVITFYWRTALRITAGGIKALNSFWGVLLPSTRILHHKFFFLFSPFFSLWNEKQRKKNSILKLLTLQSFFLWFSSEIRKKRRWCNSLRINPQ